MTERPLNLTQFGELIGSTRQHVRVLVDLGVIAAFNIAAPGMRAQWRVDSSEVEAFKARRGNNHVNWGNSNLNVDVETGPDTIERGKSEHGD